MEVCIRRAKPGDEETLAMIQIKSWQSAFADILDRETLEGCTDFERVTATYRRLLEQGIGNGYLLTVDGKPHCIAWWDRSRTQQMAEYAELICIHSLPDRWRQGFGSRMMERVLSDMAVAGYRQVMLWVFAENTRARRFYEANGFFTNGEQKPQLLPVELCYQKRL